MKNLLLIATMLITTSYAQDFIILKTGEEIKAKVKEINLDDIKYLNFDNPSGPTYTMLKKDVFMIKYENGTKDILNPVQSTPSNAAVAPKQPKPVIKQKELKVKPTINRDYLQDTEYRKNKSSGIALTTVGTFLFGAGALPMVTIGSILLPQIENDPETYGMWVGVTSAGAAIFAGSIAMIAVGAIQIEKAKAIKNRYQNGSVYMNIQPGVTGGKFTLNF